MEEVIIIVDRMCLASADWSQDRFLDNAIRRFTREVLECLGLLESAWPAFSGSDDDVGVEFFGWVSQ
jgi:hypothetical protein